MNKRRILRRGVWIALFLVLLTTSAFADYTISWQSKDGSPIVSSSSAGVKCDGQLEASNYLLNTGESVSIRLIPGAAPQDFIGRAKQHNTSTKYEYRGIYSYEIDIDGKEYEVNSLDYSFSKPGDYEVKGYITFWWETKKTNAGFPRYYYKKRVMKKIIRVSDLEDAASPEQPDSPDGKEESEEEVKPSLAGMVFHTRDWEENRKHFNEYCENSGRKQWQRAADVYWSGEKFCLSAIAAGKNQPATVKVKIEETPYETTLHREERSWEGVLFDKSMIDRWGRNGPEKLKFVFSAIIDGSYCEDIQWVTVDDLHKYWLMHRKE